MSAFRISDYVEFNSKNRASCPCCEAEGKKRNTNLSLVPNTDGAYKCHRGCTPQQIREALGNPKPSVVPTAIAKPTVAPSSLTVSPQKVREAHETLMQSNGPAKAWLHQRGITDEMIIRYQLGIVRAKSGERKLPSISIPIPNDDLTAYYQKKRVAPWLLENERPEGYQPWSQAGIPARVFFTYRPVEAEETWLCEGEWDAILLGWYVQEAELLIAVASFTAGCGNVPPQDQLDLLPGMVITFYDRNDKPLKNGDRPGEVGARKVALALGERARIGLVPMPEDCQVQGWDVSDALNQGYRVAAFLEAAKNAFKLHGTQKDENPLWKRLQWNDELLDTAPGHTEWLVPGLLTANELFLLAAGPRSGKSLLSMTLAKAVATGGTFLERPVTQGTVIYIRCEDGPAKTKEREISQGWGRGLPVAWINKFKLSELEYLRQMALELDPRLIVLDTLSRIRDAGISESSAEMSQVLEPLQELAEEIDCCIVLVHHTGKVSVENANTFDIFDTIRGSSAIRAVCRGTLILAAGEGNMRLFVENGWDKQDLNVVLDKLTSTWRLLGRWEPTVNGTQQEAVVEYLRTRQKATLEEMHTDLGISKRSLYEVLDRLRTSQVAEHRVIKEGSRRHYTYRLELSTSIQQLNNLLNSANEDGESDRDRLQRKNLSSFSRNGVDSGHSSDAYHSPPKHVHSAEHSNQGGQPSQTEAGEETQPFGIAHVTEPQNADEKEFPENVHFGSNLTNEKVLNKGVKRGSNRSRKGVSPIQQPTQNNSTVDKENSEPAQLPFQKGDKVEVLTQQGWRKGLYKGIGQGSYLSHSTRTLDEAHWVTIRGGQVKAAKSDIRRREE